jgi:hypothetical protein
MYKLLAEIITNAPAGIIIYTPDISEFMASINERPGYPFTYKNIPDDYVSKLGYTWQRRNNRKFLIWKPKD